jgi:hypothetical protein
MSQYPENALLILVDKKNQHFINRLSVNNVNSIVY